MMRSKTFKVIALFSAFGLAAGLLTACSHLMVPYISLGAGVFFLVGLVLCILISGISRQLFLSTPRWRKVGAASLIVPACPLSFLAMPLTAFIYDWAYFLFAPVSYQQRVNSFDSPKSDGSLIGLFFLAPLAGALLMSLALRLITRKWDKTVVALLVVAGLASLPLSFAIAMLADYPRANLIVYPMGETFFGGLSGYWLLRAERSDGLRNGAV